jgi:hypothetical protein
MAQDIAVFDEATAKDVLETIRALKDSGLLGQNTGELKQSLPGQQVYNTPIPTLVYNDSAYEIPAYGLMQMTTTLNEDGRNYVKVKRPIDSTLLRCPLLINGPTAIVAGAYGCAQPGPTFRLLHDGGTYVAGDRLGAKTATFTATYGALFAVIGSDSIDTNIVRVMFDTSPFKGKTKSVPLVAGVPANVYYTDATGTVTTTEYLAETDGSEIPANSAIWLFPMYGRLVASLVC